MKFPKSEDVDRDPPLRLNTAFLKTPDEVAKESLRDSFMGDPRSAFVQRMVLAP